MKLPWWMRDSRIVWRGGKPFVEVTVHPVYLAWVRFCAMWAVLRAVRIDFDRRAFARDTFVGRMLGEYRWFRRWAGGHWERWWVDAVHSEVWMSVSACSSESHDRPSPLCRGTPLCEAHREFFGGSSCA